MYILGFSGIASGNYYREKYGIRFVGHDSAVALVHDGKVIFAVEEERLSRDKHTSYFPLHAIRYALTTAHLELKDIAMISYTWNATPIRILRMCLHHPSRIPFWHWPSLAATGTKVLRDLMSPRQITKQLSRALGEALPGCYAVPHHLTHAACAYFTSAFDQAASLTVDGQGEDESATLGEWNGTQYRKFQSIYSPDSIGILYGMVTDFLGMRAAWDEYKVMGMASFGDPVRFSTLFDKLVQLGPSGKYRTLRTAMVFKPGYCDRFLEKIFQVPKRLPSTDLQQVHFDIADSLQAKTEEVLFHLLKHLRQLSSSKNLCLAGGVFLNSVANGKIWKSGFFENVYIPPVPGDHGGALGAAILTYYQKSKASRHDMQFTPFIGPAYSEQEIEKTICSYENRITYRKPAELTEEISKLLHENKVIGWFQGRLEYGPRALGHRSILANPISREMKEIVNKRIKHREEFRPFAGAVPLEEASQYFDMMGASPYMQCVFPVRTEEQLKIPSILHHGTCRVQTVRKEDYPLFHKLLYAFKRRTGVPILLNTSFNDRDEPIVCSPQDALQTFLNTDIDALVIGPFLIEKVYRTNSFD